MGSYFFPGDSKIYLGCEYFYGVACVFITYAGSLYEQFVSSENAPCLTEFHQCLNEHMLRNAVDWSQTAILGNEKWKVLRLCSKKALIELHELLPEVPLEIDIESLINPSEFRTSDEIKELLE